LPKRRLNPPFVFVGEKKKALMPPFLTGSLVRLAHDPLELAGTTYPKPNIVVKKTLLHFV
jgi:hypothetical protein